MDFLHDSTAPSPSGSFDSTACVALAERHVPRMLQVARSILGCEDLAWDAVQDALMCLWHERHAPHDLCGWLVRTTVHKSLHHVRSRARRTRHELLAVGARELDLGSDPAELAARTDLARAILAAIHALPTTFREPFALRELEGLDYAEIAARLGLAPGTVRSRIHRAKALLRTSLADLLHDPALCALCQDDDSHPHG
jgi:RNA polymerase sigma-70 factor (ECF subfamily)